MREPLFALTSLSPAPDNQPRQQAAILSWRAAGLIVYSFNHPSEIDVLAPTYDLSFVPVEKTTAAQFGRPYIPIKAILDWAEQKATPVLLLNSDIELRLTSAELYRLRWLGDHGLVYFVRFNHNGDFDRATPDPWGIDAFLFHGRNSSLFAESFLSMGQPYWDYWLPVTFSARGRPVWAVESPVAFHADHTLQWSWSNWHCCALEFDRLTGVLGNDRSLEACAAMCHRVRDHIVQYRQVISPRPDNIRNWVEQRFSRPGPKVFLELGAHQGNDTAWLARIPDVTVHAFEPDPRNHAAQMPNVIMNRAAIAERNGRGQFILSRHGWGQDWTYSSSLKRPKNHLHRYPVTFGETIEVQTIQLDSYTHMWELPVIDLIWCKIQGAEGEMVRGAIETLQRTRYLYTAFSDDELYEGQSTLAEILRLLPTFRVLELWEGEALLENGSVLA